MDFFFGKLRASIEPSDALLSFGAEGADAIVTQDLSVRERLESYETMPWVKAVAGSVAERIEETVWTLYPHIQERPVAPIPSGPQHQRMVKPATADKLPGEMGGLREVGREGLTRRLNAGLAWMDYDFTKTSRNSRGSKR